MKALLVLAAAIPLASCQTDPACRARNSVAFIPSPERYRAMTVQQRRDDAARYNELARRCGWEP